MSSKLQIRNVNLGEGLPKICIPLLGTTTAELLDEVAAALPMQPDVLEWRVDYFSAREDGIEVLQALREAAGEAIPLLFTLRTKREGGAFAGEASAYEQVIVSAAESGFVDLVDIELFTPAQTLQAILDALRHTNVKTLLSNHDFISTPSKHEMLRRLRQMEALGADVLKIAVMPNSPGDVVTLLDVMQEFAKNATRPLIAMSMGHMGMISRIAGETFGSCMTFGCAAKASAPGQIPAKELEHMLKVLHGEADYITI